MDVVLDSEGRPAVERLPTGPSASRPAHTRIRERAGISDHSRVIVEIESLLPLSKTLRPLGPSVRLGRVLLGRGHRKPDYSASRLSLVPTLFRWTAS